MNKLRPQTWNSHALNDATYESHFNIDSGIDGTAPVEAIVAEAVAGPPTYQRRLIKERRLVLRVELKANKTQANVEQLFKWFDPTIGEVVLVARDEAGTDRQLNAVCVSRSAVGGADWMWDFVLLAADGRWQTGQNTTNWTVGASGGTTAITNGGTTLHYPRIRIKPVVQKAAAGGWLYRRRIAVANRASLALAGVNGALGYPILLFDGIWDHASLVTGLKSMASGDDVRVFVDGAEWPRSVDAWNTGTTKLWSPLMLPPQRSAKCEDGKLPAAVTTLVPVVGMTTNISNWPSSAFVLAHNQTEVIYYESRDDWHLYNVHRAMWGTSAALWGSNTIMYPVVHDVQVLYGFTSAPVPPWWDFAADLDTIIDKAASTNVLHKWASYWNRTTRKSRQFLPEYVERNPRDAKVSLGDTLSQFRDTEGLLPKNALGIDCPVPIANTAGAITHDVSIVPSLAIFVYGKDALGNSDVLLKSIYEGSADEGTGKTITPPQQLTQLRYEAHQVVITGSNAAAGTDVLITSVNSLAFTWPLDEAQNIAALQFRIKKTGTPTQNLLVDLYAVNNGQIDTSAKLVPQMAFAPADVTAAYATYTKILAAVAPLAAGTYAVAFTTNESGGGNSYSVQTSDTKSFARGELRTGGQKTVSAYLSFDGYTLTVPTDYEWGNSPSNDLLARSDARIYAKYDLSDLPQGKDVVAVTRYMRTKVSAASTLDSIASAYLPDLEGSRGTQELHGDTAANKASALAGPTTSTNISNTTYSDLSLALGGQFNLYVKNARERGLFFDMKIGSTSGVNFVHEERIEAGCPRKTIAASPTGLTQRGAGAYPANVKVNATGIGTGYVAVNDMVQIGGLDQVAAGLYNGVWQCLEVIDANNITINAVWTSNSGAGEIRKWNPANKRLLITYADPDFDTKASGSPWFRVLGDQAMKPQPEAPLGDVSAASVANTILAYAGGSPPLARNRPEESCYLFYDAVLKVTHPDGTTQSMTIRLPVTLNDEFEIDCEKKTIKWVTVGAANNEVVGRSCAHAVAFDDDEGWFHFAPGSNTLQWTEPGMAANGVALTVYSKSAY